MALALAPNNPCPALHQDTYQMEIYPIPSKSYLDRTVEQLETSGKNIATMKRYATAYKISAYVVLGFFVVSATAAMIFVGLFAAPYVPIVIITCFCLQSSAFSIYKRILNTANAYSEAAERMRLIVLEYETINTDPSSSDTVKGLLNYQANDVMTHHLKPLLAHYNYWIKQYDHYQSEAQKEIEKAQVSEVILPEAPPSRSLRLTKKEEPAPPVVHYVEAHNLKQQALVAKVSAAFIIAAMNNTSFNGKAENICAIRTFNIFVDHTQKTLTAPLESNSWPLYTLYREFDDPRASSFLQFKNQDPPLSLTEVQTLRVDAIAKRLLHAMQRTYICSICG